MRILPVRALSHDAFLDHGWYRDLADTTAAHLGVPPVTFFRDQIQQPVDGAVSYSICRVEPRPLVIDTSEQHSRCHEMLLPLDGDMLLHVGPACPPADGPPLDRFAVFRVPRLTLVVLRPGVWHHAPFAIGAAALNCLVGLPERTYANDCTVVCLAEELRLGIAP